MSSEVIDSFSGRHRFLSNFYPSKVILGGFVVPTVEHAFQMAKTLDVKEQLAIAQLDTPGQAKRKGRMVTLREDWDERCNKHSAFRLQNGSMLVKDAAMLFLLRQKFSFHRELQDALLNTGEATLIEGNHWHDNYWGICTCEDCDRNRDADGHPGENILGGLLEQVRSEIRVVVELNGC